MTIITVTRSLPSTPAQVWEVLRDIAGIENFHPVVQSSPLNAGSGPDGLGASRTCTFYDGNHVVEEVVGWDEGRSMTIEIVDGSMPIQPGARAHIEVTPEGTGTQVAFTMDYTVKFGPLGAVMNVLMMKRQFAKVIDGLLAGLDVHVRTGERIGPDFDAAAA